MSNDTPEIKLNGEPFSIESDCTIEALLLQIAKNNSTTTGSSNNFGAVAVELNAEIVPRDKFAETLLKNGDTVEVVTLVGGG